VELVGQRMESRKVRKAERKKDQGLKGERGTEGEKGGRAEGKED